MSTEELAPLLLARHRKWLLTARGSVPTVADRATIVSGHSRIKAVERYEFRRASEDFKRTWEREVNLEHTDQGIDPQLENSILDKAAERIRAAREASAIDSNSAAPSASVITPSVTAIDPSLVQPREVKPPETVAADQTPGKHDWL